LNAELAKDNSVDELSAADFDLSIIVLLKDINGDVFIGDKLGGLSPLL